MNGTKIGQERRRRLGLRKKLGLTLFSKLYKDRVEQHPLRTLFWECTMRCNLDCRHCGSDCKSDSVLNAEAKTTPSVVPTATPPLQGGDSGNSPP
jgi:hypothetical protein